jgi:hypothetical protein
MLKESWWDKAEGVLEDLLQKRPLPKLFAQSYGKSNGKPPEARSKKPADSGSGPIVAKPAFYMAELRNGQNRKEEVHFYIGIHYFELRDMSSAGYHLRKALALAKDAVRKKQIEQMLDGVDRAQNRSVSNRRRRPS